VGGGRERRGESESERRERERGGRGGKGKRGVSEGEKVRGGEREGRTEGRG